MRIGPVTTAIVSTALVVVYAAGSGLWVATGDAWYRSLVRPAWQPPDVVFGVIWPYNFAALIAAGLAVALGGSDTARWSWLAALLLSVISALAWARLFYVDHALVGAAVALVLACLITIVAVAAAWRTRTWAGVVLVPYVVWLALAASLSIEYARRN